MASKAFANVVANLKLNKNMDSVIVGGTYLAEGVHDVTVQAIDTTEVDANKVKITYVTADGKTYVDRMFALNMDKSEFSFGLKALWSATLGDKDAIFQLLSMVSDNPAELQVLTGMKLRITLAYGKGVQARSTGINKFAGYDVETGDVQTPEYDNIKEVYEDIKARAIKRSYLQIKRSEITDKDTNLIAFAHAVISNEPSAAPPFKLAQGI